MATFSNKVAIGICDRCNFKFKLSELRPDGNSPGLLVCAADWDPKSPWRLPPIQPDAICLQYPRPDTPLWPTQPNIPNGIPFWDDNAITWDDGLTVWL